MRKGLIGKKLGMTQVWDAKGVVIPVTVIEAGPCVVANIKTKAIDGYDAMVVGFGEISEAKTKKAQLGAFKKHNIAPHKHLAEFDNTGKSIGDKIEVDIFEEGEMVDISGTTRGRGFSGNIVRWNASRLKMTHGTGPVHRSVGSVGANSTPSRVHKGKKMPGQYGNEASTVLNLKIIKIDPAKNLILVKGAVPGAKGSLVEVRTAVKVKKAK